MLYESTRNSSISFSSTKAITEGISAEGGLFMPKCFPQFSKSEFKSYIGKNYNEIAKFIMGRFLDDFESEEIARFVDAAYNTDRFDTSEIVPVVKVGDNFFLELWHGPTCAFKDMALQMLPHFMVYSAKKEGDDSEIIILVATSGDTGKAALEGFADIDGIKIAVFYPESGVSDTQKLQMITQEGENVYVAAVKGNFDDAQTGIKKIFTDNSLKEQLAKSGYKFSTANSINWGRLLPQIVYYVYGYLKLVSDNEIEYGDKIDVVVPTGNFGNILAAYIAKILGMPFDKLICASNENNVLTDFLNTGVYNKKRDFKQTYSPSMDILISSNLERLIYLATDRDDSEVATLYSEIAKNGSFEISENAFKKIKENFLGGFCSDDTTVETIKRYFEEYNYLTDPHTAVAAEVGDRLSDKKRLVAATANPYKFTDVIAKALSLSDDATAEEISEITKTKIPAPLRNLDKKQVRFTDSFDKENLFSAIEEHWEI